MPEPFTIGAALASSVPALAEGLGLSMGASAEEGPAYSPPVNASLRNRVTVAPVGVNLGAMILPYNSGPDVNGGMPLEAVAGNTRVATGTPSRIPTLPLLALAAGGVLVLLLAMRRR